MPTLMKSQLQKISCDIFQAAGALPEESRIVTDALIEANLDGHDSHGVVRVAEYVQWMEEGRINHGAKIEVETETECLAVINANWGWGQVKAQEAMKLVLRKASTTGLAALSLHDCNHIGRAGDYPAMAAREGMAAVLFVNTHGGGKLVAPWGGRERRLSANPIAAAIPRADGEPIVLDISTCAIAGGKVHIAYNKHKPVPPNCLIDAQGHATTNPADFYGPPEGALLPMAGHKGYGLAILCDVLAGALSGAGCSRPTTDRVGNAFLAVVLDIAKFRDRKAFDESVEGLIQYLKGSPLAEGFSEILIPGEPERREHRIREKNGIPIDDGTWKEITDTADKYHVRISLAHPTA